MGGGFTLIVHELLTILLPDSDQELIHAHRARQDVERVSKLSFR